jgi:hypothetical protein
LLLALTRGNVGFSLSQECNLKYSEYRLSKFIALDFVVRLPVKALDTLTEVLHGFSYFMQGTFKDSI